MNSSRAMHTKRAQEPEGTDTAGGINAEEGGDKKRLPSHHGADGRFRNIWDPHDEMGFRQVFDLFSFFLG